MKLKDRERCDSCRSTYIYFRNTTQDYKCRTCGNEFTMPLRNEDTKRGSGSGVIAPRTYRQQIAWEGVHKS